MLRRTLSLSALSLLAAFGGSAVGQVPPPAAPVPAGGNQTAYRAKQVLGSTVNIDGNQGVGTVDDIVFDQNGQIEYLIVAEQGRMVSVPWEATRFNQEQRVAVVNITPERYRAIPSFTVQTYPNFYTPAYRTETYRYYGLTPGQARRVERQLDRR